jgi:hypothetical protein
MKKLVLVLVLILIFGLGVGFAFAAYPDEPEDPAPHWVTPWE